MESTQIYISFIRQTDNQSLSRSIEYVYKVLNRFRRQLPLHKGARYGIYADLYKLYSAD